ncbi:MAG: hypothetical protein ACI9R3_002824 [Verrucomicrobiales bacterium]|jgi:hypothetical protein
MGGSFQKKGSPRTEMNLNLSNINIFDMCLPLAQVGSLCALTSSAERSQSFPALEFSPDSKAVEEVNRKVQFSSFCPADVARWRVTRVDIGASIVAFAAPVAACINGQIFTGAILESALSVLRFLPHAMPGGGSMPLASSVPTFFSSFEENGVVHSRVL